MVEIQQLIVKAKINSGELEDQNIVQTVNSIIENYLKSKGVVKDLEKKEIVEECIKEILEKIEHKSRL
ncbi:MAG: hypothetical protein CMC10_01365 [Flavobacteriaceae bacterium]|nr:hypothetical protein [Flavobacteriaceae bacterium]|tara:strand:- start:29 stop:232 length:204 start_codon:yes stop_codon:yes gene_type:complete